jgi:hypothetical protein
VCLYRLTFKEGRAANWLAPCVMESKAKLAAFE